MAEYEAREKRKSDLEDARKAKRENALAKADAAVLKAEQARSDAEVRQTKAMEVTKVERAKLEDVLVHCVHVGVDVKADVDGDVRAKSLVDIQGVKSALGTASPKIRWHRWSHSGELGVEARSHLPSDNEEEEKKSRKGHLATEAAEGVADAGRCALRVADFRTGRRLRRRMRLGTRCAYEQATPRTRRPTRA